MSHAGPAPWHINPRWKNLLASEILIVTHSLMILEECYHSVNFTLRNIQQIPKTAQLVLL